jgi:DNA-binding MarR family transcriptional regulator
MVELTAEGEAALERAERAQESIGDEMFAGLTPAERATLRSLLSRALEPVAS